MKYSFWTWRPPKFETVEEMQEKISEYFDSWHDTIEIPNQYGSTKLPVLTITWLALFLWFASRQSFYDYENPERKGEEFAYTIKRARAFIEHEYEKQLQRGNTTGAIFALKNFGWKDTQILEGDFNNNNKNRMVVEYVEADHANFDKDWNPIKQENE